MDSIAYTYLMCFNCIFLLATSEANIYSPRCDTNTTADAPTYYYWTRNNTERSFVVNGTQLTFHNTNRTISGDYFCVASNNTNHTEDEQIVDTITIDVQYAPRQEAGQEFVVPVYWGIANPILVMEYTAIPVPSITWEHNGDILPNSFDRKTKDGEARVTYLNVTSLIIDDFLSNYTLTISNDLGGFHAAYMLLAVGNPQIPRDLEAYNITSNSVTLQWMSGFDMGSPQHFDVMSKIGHGFYFPTFNVVKDTSKTHGINQTWTYTMTNLRSGTSYTMTVYSKNSYGESLVRAIPVHFRTERNDASSSTKSAYILLVTLLAAYSWL